MSWLRRIPAWISLVIAAMVAYAVIVYFREGFQPEFLNQGNVVRTQETTNSSYKQETNAVPVDGRFAAPPIQGVESPFRVNMFNSYIP
jgi:hypothetical protein